MSARRYLWVIVVVVLGVLGTYGYRHFSVGSSDTAAVTNDRRSAPTEMAQLRETLAQPVAIAHQTRENVSGSGKEQLPECEAFSDQLLENDSRSVLESLREGKWKLSSDCFTAMSSLSHFVGKLSSVCLEPKISKKDLDQCHAYLVYMKGSLVRELLKAEPVRSLGDRELLLSSLGAVMETGNPQESDFAIAAADELLLRGKFELTAHKVKIATLFDSVDMEKPETREALLSSVEAAVAHMPDNPELKDISLASRVFVDPVEKRTAIYKKYIHDNPGDPLGYYYAASSYWHMENRQQAIKLLERAVRLNPSNSRYQEALKNAKTQNLGQQIFTIQISMPFDGGI